MKTEQIIKALECFASDDDCVGRACPYFTVGCEKIMAKDALALIKEQQKELTYCYDKLTELEKECLGLSLHNITLKKENKYLRERRDEETEHAKDLAITDTVKKMQDKLKAAFCPDADYFGCDIHSAINEKAKEILNESQ